MKPKMILFDYGQTMVVEPQFDYDRAYGALYSHILGVPTVSKEEFFKVADERLIEAGAVHDLNREFDNIKFIKSLFDYLHMTPDIPYGECELALWDDATHGSHASEGAESFLAEVRDAGIRIGIVSNLSFSKENLVKRLERYFPNECFDFVIASSDILIRKPEPFIFRYALSLAKLSAEDVWFIGDDPTADICGAYGVGIKPILYTGAHKRSYDCNALGFDFARADSFSEISRILKEALL